MLALRANHVEFIMIAGGGVWHEQLPISDAAHPHRMPPRIPEIEIADDADPLGIGGQHHKRYAGHAIEHHRMRAKLVVDPLMGAFAQQIQIEVGQNRRKAIGIVEIDHLVAEAGAQLVTLGAVGQGTCEQSRVVDACQRSGFAVLTDRIDLGRLGQEGAYHGLATLGMQAKIVKRIGMAAFHNRIGLCG